MRPSGRILDHNLGELLRRAYAPARPRREFVVRLERVLGPWIGEEPTDQVSLSPVRAPRLRRIGFAVLAVAAAFLLLLVIRPDGEEGGDPSRGALASLLAAREVAVRRAEEAPWRAAGGDELTLDSTYLELATPARKEIVVRGAGGWTARLRETGRLRVEEGDEGLRFTVLSGSARFEVERGGRESGAPLELYWRAGSFHDRNGTLWLPLPAGGDEAGIREPVKVVSAGPSEELEEPPDPVSPGRGTASLLGLVSVPDGEESPGLLEVTLLQVVALPQVAMPVTRLFELAGGSFRWDGVEPGRYSVFIQADGWAVHRCLGIDLVSDSTHELDVELARGGRIIGYVVDRESGAAIAGALVVSERDLPMRVVPSRADEFPEAARAFTFTRADGSFELRSLSSGAHRLRAGGTRHAPSWSEPVPVIGEEATGGVILELGPGGGIAGRVESPDGRPAPGVQVVISRYVGVGEFTSMTYASAVTDEEGDYVAEHLAPGAYVVLEFGDGSVEAREHEPRYTPTRIEEGRVARVDFLGLGTGARLSGLVRDGSGRPIPRANVYLCEAGDRWTTWEGNTATTEGLFEIEGIEPGSYWLYAGSGDCFALIESLTFEAGEERRIEVVLRGRSLEVQVTDAQTGTPVSDAILMLFEAPYGAGGDGDPDVLTARTWFGAGGTYTLDFLPEGAFDLLVVAESGSHAPAWRRDVLLARAGGGETISIALERAGSVRVHVEDGAGRPVSGARVELTRSSSTAHGDPSRREVEETGDDGDARVRYLLPGRWTARVHHGGYRERVLPVEVTAEVVTPLRVVLEAE